MELVGRTIWGESRYMHDVDEKCVIYCTLQKNKEEAVVDFVVGLPGGNAWMSREESKEYRLGIEGDVGAFSGKHPDRVLVNFYEKDAAFADFYTEDGQIIKKMVIHDHKFYVFDEDAYYEASSDAEHPGLESHETIISKDEKHKYLHSDIISEKEKFAKTFLEMFESLR